MPDLGHREQKTDVDKMLTGFDNLDNEYKMSSYPLINKLYITS